MNKVRMFDTTEVTYPKYMSDEEVKKYIEYLEDKSVENGIRRFVDKLTITLEDDNEVGLKYTYKPVNFERLRRITGYLVGDTSRWNDAKKSELNDRVKHGGYSNGIEKI